MFDIGTPTTVYFSARVYKVHTALGVISLACMNMITCFEHQEALSLAIVLLSEIKTMLGCMNNNIYRGPAVQLARPSPREKRGVFVYRQLLTARPIRSIINTLLNCDCH